MKHPAPAEGEACGLPGCYEPAAEQEAVGVMVHGDGDFYGLAWLHLCHRHHQALTERTP